MSEDSSPGADSDNQDASEHTGRTKFWRRLHFHQKVSLATLLLLALSLPFATWATLQQTRLLSKAYQPVTPPDPTPTSSLSPTPSPNRKPVIITSSLPDGTLNQSYSAAINGVDLGVMPGDTLTMSTSGLPRGLILDPGKCQTTPQGKRLTIRCRFAGQPKETGKFSVKATLTDNYGAAAQKVLPLVINRQ